MKKILLLLLCITSISISFAQDDTSTFKASRLIITMKNIGNTGKDSTSDIVGNYAISVNESKKYVAFLANGEEQSRSEIINREYINGFMIYLLSDYKGDKDILVITQTEAIILAETITVRYIPAR